MKILRLTSNLLITIACVIAMAVPVAHAGLVWSPETGWVGTSGAVKDSPKDQLTHSMALFEREEYGVRYLR